MAERGGLEATLSGTPQGGILSPLMANIALSALDEHFASAWEAMGSQHQRYARRRRGEATYRLVRYADDFVILVAGGRAHAQELIAQTETVLAPLGLALLGRSRGAAPRVESCRCCRCLWAKTRPRAFSASPKPLVVHGWRALAARGPSTAS